MGQTVHLPDDKTAETVSAGVVNALRPLPEHMRRTLTWDRGMEMAEHEAVTMATRMPVFFCDAASPWQRPTNENTVILGEARRAVARAGWVLAA